MDLSPAEWPARVAMGASRDHWVLMTYDGHSLVALDMTEHVGLEPGDLCAGRLFVGSLQGFLILRRLRVRFC